MIGGQFSGRHVEPPTAHDVIEHQRSVLLEIRRILTDLNGCLDYLDVLGRIDVAVKRGLDNMTGESR